MDSKFYSIIELTEILKLHPKTILRFIHEGKIKAKKIGRSWRVSEHDFREYCHDELREEKINVHPEFETLEKRINISAVVEVIEQNSEEASRISNSFMAMLNSDREPDGRSRFDFFYYPEIQKAKYVFYGSPKFLLKIISIFDTLMQQTKK